jgi:hypothetical protein
MYLLTLILSLALTGTAHARYEDAIYGEGHTIGEGNLLPYIVIGLSIWLLWVWEDGWRKRALPLTVMALAGLVWFVWGLSGLGLMVISGCLVGIAYGALRRG